MDAHKDISMELEQHRLAQREQWHMVEFATEALYYLSSSIYVKERLVEGEGLAALVKLTKSSNVRHSMLLGIAHILRDLSSCKVRKLSLHHTTLPSSDTFESNWRY